jgi:hypothetical protein
MKNLMLAGLLIIFGLCKGFSAKIESNYAYLAPVSIIAGSYSMLEAAVDAAKSDNKAVLDLLVLDKDIIMKGYKITVMIVKRDSEADYAEVIIPSIGGINHLFVRNRDLLDMVTQ